MIHLLKLHYTYLRGPVTETQPIVVEDHLDDLYDTRDKNPRRMGVRQSMCMVSRLGTSIRDGN